MIDNDEPGSSQMLRRRRTDGSRLAEARSIDRVATVATSVFVIGGGNKSRRASISQLPQQQPALNDVPFLSRQATIGRNSQFHNLTSGDRETLGGIEYRSLKLLLKVVLGESGCLHAPRNALEAAAYMLSDSCVCVSVSASLLLRSSSYWRHMPPSMDQAGCSCLQRHAQRISSQRYVVV